MPPLKILHVATFTSEDKKFCADNLLKDETYLKWKCATAGEKQAAVVFQLEKSSCIHSIDIGNEGSAFVEVLAGRQGDNDEQNYKVLLAASSFMSPVESRNETNMSRVRMFGPDKLSKAMEEKWDRVKVVCTQPFNKHMQYGLAFIKFHSPPESGESEKSSFSTTKLKLGAFTLKDDESDALQPGSLFAKRKTDGPSSSLALNASNLAPKVKNVTKESEEKKDVPSAKRKLQTLESSSNTPIKKRTVEGQNSGSEKKKAPSAAGLRKLSDQGNLKPQKKQSSSSSAPSQKVMSGVVFALSGFVNPQRADLRDKALELGAKYRPDWDKSCTHLVCAFANTPKFLQVRKEGGKIVSLKWIVDCHRKKNLLPWKEYRLIDESSASSSGSGEDSDGKHETGSSQKAPASIAAADEYGSSTDVERDQDTDDEIDRVRGETFPDWPGVFRGKYFLLYGDYDDSERKELKRYIIAFKGKLLDMMSDEVTHVITEEDWDDKFDDALATNDKLQFIRSEWLLRCADQRSCISEKSYVIAKSK